MTNYTILIRLITLVTVLITINTASNYAAVTTEDPITINSEGFTIDYANGYAVYSKNVVLNQSDKTLTSDNLYIYFEKNNKINKNTKNNSSIKTIIATSADHNQPVVYKQNVTNKKTKNNSDKNFMVAKADTMKFEAINNKIILEKNAIIEQNNRILTSELLYYDLKQEIAYMPKVNNQRSKIIL